jgi:hypothetical protein
VNDLVAWLQSRTPAPPTELRAAVDRAIGAAPGADDSAGGAAVDAEAATEAMSTVAMLDRATRLCLDEALARPGRVRESAFALLAADALLTYACEAALDSDDPDRALRGLLPGLLEASDAS